MTISTETLTPEQQAALDSTSRLTVINAGPGSGKTRLFVEAVRTYLTKWHDASVGLAALSFTNVAQNEIAHRLGARLRWPHFVGTLDSFLLRFIVRPFGSLVGVSSGGIRLIPSPLDNEMEFPEVRIGTRPQDKIAIYKVRYNQGTESSPTFRFNQTTYGRMSDADGVLAERIQRQKQSLWNKAGRTTHSDTHYLASRILAEHPKVADLLAIRFPVILVDELQDTSWFLGRALINILRVPTIQSLVVGDPDQAIYEFGGATPTIFRQIEGLAGSKSYSLKESQRCPIRVCKIATSLSQSKSTVTAKATAPEGMSTLLIHNLDRPLPDPALITKIVAIAGLSDVAILARRNPTLWRLRGDESASSFPGGSVLARTIHSACELLRRGLAQQANRIVGRALAKEAFDDEVITETKLRAKGFSAMQWRTGCFRILSRATESTTPKWDDWLSELRTAIEGELEQLTGGTYSLGQKTKAGHRRETTRSYESPRGSSIMAVIISLYDGSPSKGPRVSQRSALPAKTARHARSLPDESVVCFRVRGKTHRFRRCDPRKIGFRFVRPQENIRLHDGTANAVPRPFHGTDRPRMKMR